jgi:ubiquinone/menaquinone biosynthesis C-methylase UbiE
MQKELYDCHNNWGKEYHKINFDRAKLTAAAIPNDTAIILDIGCGDGLVLSMLRDSGYDAVGFDLSYHALKHIKNVKLVQGSACHLPFSSNSFDCVMACEVLEHIPDNIFNSVLEEISRVTKKYVIITVPYKEKLEINYACCEACGCIFNGAYHLRSFKSEDLKILLTETVSIRVDKIVEILNPDRTFSLELFVRQHLANEYLYYNHSVKCPLCLSKIINKPNRNWIGWISAGMRFLYRFFHRKKSPLWYLAIYKKK